MNWLITGGCGFIGTSLISALRECPTNRIRVVDNLSVGGECDLDKVCSYDRADTSTLCWGDTVNLVVGDVRDQELAVKSSEGADVVVHLAANTGVGPSVEDPRLDMDINVVGTFNYLEAARINGVTRFVFASSGAPGGEVEPPIHENLPAKPVSPYGASKLAGEAYCSAYARSYGVSSVALRFGNVYGPGSTHKASVVAKFIKRVISHQDIEIFGDGSQTRDFIYISDLVSAILLAASKRDIAGEVFQIATNSEISVAELIEEMTDIFRDFGIQSPVIKNTAPRLGDVKRNYSDTSKAKEVLGWSSITSLQEGLLKTVEYFVGGEGVEK